MPGMTIARLADAGGVGVETVRYYQRRGLLAQPDRAGHGFRRYEEDDVRRLRFIRTAQGAGFTLDEIGQLLALDAVDDRARIRDLAVARISALDSQIDKLTATRAALARLADACRSGREGACPIVTAFAAST